jgi:hypothetical protein
VFATAVPDTVLVDGSLASAVAAKLGIAISDVALARVPGAHPATPVWSNPGPQ